MRCLDLFPIFLDTRLIISRIVRCVRVHMCWRYWSDGLTPPFISPILSSLLQQKQCRKILILIHQRTQGRDYQPQYQQTLDTVNPQYNINSLVLSQVAKFRSFFLFFRAKVCVGGGDSYPHCNYASDPCSGPLRDYIVLYGGGREPESWSSSGGTSGLRGEMGLLLPISLTVVLYVSVLI